MSARKKRDLAQASGINKINRLPRVTDSHLKFTRIGTEVA